MNICYEEFDLAKRKKALEIKGMVDDYIKANRMVNNDVVSTAPSGSVAPDFLKHGKHGGYRIPKNIGQRVLPQKMKRRNRGRPN